MEVAPGGGGFTNAAYQLVGVVNTFRLNQNNTTTPLVEITARSLAYDVLFTWDVLASTYLADGPDTLAQQKANEVAAICAHAHVQTFRTEQDQDRSGLLYNYAVIGVGTADLAIVVEVTARMDQLDEPGVFTAIDAAWNQLAAAGVS